MLSFKETNVFEPGKLHLIFFSEFKLGALSQMKIEQVMRDGRATSPLLSTNIGEVFSNIEVLGGAGTDAVLDMKHRLEIRNISLKSEKCSLARSCHDGQGRHHDKGERVEWLSKHLGVLVSHPLGSYRLQVAVMLPTEVIINKWNSPEAFSSNKLGNMLRLKARSAEQKMKDLRSQIDTTKLAENKAYSCDYNFNWDCK